MSKPPEVIHEGDPNPRSKYNSRGEEIPDPRPMALPVDFKPPIPLDEQIRQLIKNNQIQGQLHAEGVETFEEADDFEVDDDPDPTSPYEENFDNPHIITRNEEIRAGLVSDRTPEQKKNAERLARKAEKHLKRTAKYRAYQRKKQEAAELKELAEAGEDVDD